MNKYGENSRETRQKKKWINKEKVQKTENDIEEYEEKGRAKEWERENREREGEEK